MSEMYGWLMMDLLDEEKTQVKKMVKKPRKELPRKEEEGFSWFMLKLVIGSVILLISFWIINWMFL